MAKWYASQFEGVADGTLVPASRADGRQVGAKKSTTVATKKAAQAWANGDQIYVGRIAPNEIMRGFALVSDTSFGTTTISVGTLAAPTKYVNAKTMTVVDLPTTLGPSAAAMALGPATVVEDIWVTLGVGGVGGAVVASFLMDIASVK